MILSFFSKPVKITLPSNCTAPTQPVYPIHVTMVGCVRKLWRASTAHAWDPSTGKRVQIMFSLVYSIAVLTLSFRAVYLTGNPLSCDKSQLSNLCAFISSEQGRFQLTPKYVIDDPLIRFHATQENVTVQLYCSYPVDSRYNEVFGTGSFPSLCSGLPL
ncbi:uncharacterized protein [Diadema setosum]|uniref:uncharacterized protein isoform X2 n=1 Tax=Diadema setosum TaxID=31175 RepID=UPI003B3AC43B